MSLGLGCLLDRGAALQETEHVFARRKHGNVALGVPRGFKGLSSWVRDLLFPGDFPLAENVGTWLACGKGKTKK